MTNDSKPDYEKLLSENKRLKQDIRALEDKVARLELSIKNRKLADPFYQAHGAKWKKGANGRIEPVVYCATCELVMTPFPADNPTTFHCTKCGTQSSFGVRDVEGIVVELEI